MDVKDINRAQSIPYKLGKIILWAIVIRVILLIIVINSRDPYIISDDRSYEELSRIYLKYAGSLWDWNAIYSTGGDGYLQVFWPYTICLFSKIFNTEYAGRILNILLSALIIPQIYHITLLITKKQQRALQAGKIMAFLPYPVLFSVFNIKDFYIMFGVIYALRLLITWQLGLKLKTREIILAILLLLGVYWARGGVVEFIGVISGLYILERFYRTKKYGKIFILCVIMSLSLFYMWDNISVAFETKLEDYGDTVLKANGLAYIQMHGLQDIYKLPFQYLYSILSPFGINLFSVFNNFTWSHLLNTLNVSLYPIAFGCLFYLFEKKHNPTFYYTTFLVYIIITSMVLAIFRHYFFLFPLHIINFVCFLDNSNKTTIRGVQICSASLFVIVLFLSFKFM